MHEHIIILLNSIDCGNHSCLWISKILQFWMTKTRTWDTSPLTVWQCVFISASTFIFLFQAKFFLSYSLSHIVLSTAAAECQCIFFIGDITSLMPWHRRNWILYPFDNVASIHWSDIVSSQLPRRSWEWNLACVPPSLGSTALRSWTSGGALTLGCISSR